MLLSAKWNEVVAFESKRTGQVPKGRDYIAYGFNHKERYPHVTSPPVTPFLLVVSSLQG